MTWVSAEAFFRNDTFSWLGPFSGSSRTACSSQEFLGHYWETQPPNPQNNWGLCCFCSTAWNFLMSVTSQVWSQHMNLDLNGEMQLVLQSTGARTLPAGEWCRDYEVWMERGSLCLEHSQKGRKQFRAESRWEISQLMMLKDWEIISLFFFLIIRLYVVWI